MVSYIIFVFFPYFFHHSSNRKDQFTVSILKFGSQDFTDFTDPGLLEIQLTLTDLSLWFCAYDVIKIKFVKFYDLSTYSKRPTC